LALLPARRRELEGAALGALVVVPVMAFLWGFMVDDALISARVAANVRAGFGHRFNAAGPVVDAVTPLGFAYVLAPFAAGGPLVAMYFAKWVGAASGVLAAAWLGKTIRVATSRRVALVPLLVLSVHAPFAAWCVSGMETGIVVLFATLALAEGAAGALAAGLAAAWRPELVPWSLALVVGRALASRPPRARVVLALALSLGPAVAVAAVRFTVFGHPFPLALWAKPSDLEHGAFYVLAALLWTGAPLLVFAPLALPRVDGQTRALLVATAVHCVALLLCGGDWMPLFRLFVPVLPGIVLAAARIADVTAPWATAVRAVAAATVSAVLLFDKGAVARGVLRQRLALIDDGRRVLAGARRIACLDVGWVGAATSAEVLDLAGVTDETVARLPGGHTSKHLPANWLERRRADRVVLLAEGPPEDPAGRAGDPRWARAVEWRVARRVRELGWGVQASLELRGTGEHYLVYRAKDTQLNAQN
jgi:hypothetical protein